VRSKLVRYPSAAEPLTGALLPIGFLALTSFLALIGALDLTGLSALTGFLPPFTGTLELMDGIRKSLQLVTVGIIVQIMIITIPVYTQAEQQFPFMFLVDFFLE
jgi:hypothetical protein